jgi:hypothetical protein
MYVTSPPKGAETNDDAMSAMSARLTEVLVENASLKSQSVRRDVIHVPVPQYVDRPETVAEIANLKKQVDALNKYRLQVVPDASQKTHPAARIIETQIVDRVVNRVPSWMLWACVYSGIALLTVGYIVGIYAGKH